MENSVDKYYEKMIYSITNGASDREQLEIILKLVKGLKSWNFYGKDYLTQLYYFGLDEVENKIKDILDKEDNYSALNKAIRDYNELKKLLSMYVVVHNIKENKFEGLCAFIKTDDRFSITNDLENMLDFWFNDILLTIKKIDDNDYELVGIEVYDRNGNLIGNFNTYGELTKKVEELNNENISD